MGFTTSGPGPGQPLQSSDSSSSKQQEEVFAVIFANSVMYGKCLCLPGALGDTGPSDLLGAGAGDSAAKLSHSL